MSLTWNVDHDARLISVTARGTLTREDLDDYLAAAAAEGAAGYRVLFDLRAASLQLRPADLAAVSAISKGRKADGSSSAIAMVVGSDAERDMAGYFVSQTTGQRPCGLFGTVAEASAWLDGGQQPDRANY